MSSQTPMTCPRCFKTTLVVRGAHSICGQCGFEAQRDLVDDLVAAIAARHFSSHDPKHEVTR